MQSAGKRTIHIARLAICGLACVVLSGCFFVPGRFMSELDIRRDGRFTYSYVGEVVFMFPPEENLTEVSWDGSMSKCFIDETGDRRPCLPAEVAIQRDAYENNAKRSREAGDDLAKLIGFNPVDTKANEILAADLMQYPGWKQVAYVGKGTFHVEYEMSGMLDRDFAFPVVPQVQMAMPFVNVARSKAGVVNISTAGLASQQLRRLLEGQTPKVDQDDPYYVSMQSALFRTKGIFMVITDAEITSTDGKLSQSGGLQRVEWIIDGKSKNAPQVQLQLDRKL